MLHLIWFNFQISFTAVATSHFEFDSIGEYNWVKLGFESINILLKIYCSDNEHEQSWNYMNNVRIGIKCK